MGRIIKEHIGKEIIEKENLFTQNEKIEIHYFKIYETDFGLYFRNWGRRGSLKQISENEFRSYTE